MEGMGMGMGWEWGWDGIGGDGWDKMGGVGWDGTGQDGTGWDGMRRDKMGRDGAGRGRTGQPSWRRGKLLTPLGEPREEAAEPQSPKRGAQCGCHTPEPLRSPCTSTLRSWTPPPGSLGAVSPPPPPRSTLSPLAPLPKTLLDAAQAADVGCLTPSCPTAPQKTAPGHHAEPRGTPLPYIPGVLGDQKPHESAPSGLILPSSPCGCVGTGFSGVFRVFVGQGAPWGCPGGRGSPAEPSPLLLFGPVTAWPG